MTAPFAPPICGLTYAPLDPPRALHRLPIQLRRFGVGFRPLTLECPPFTAGMAHKHLNELSQKAGTLRWAHTLEWPPW